MAQLKYNHYTSDMAMFTDQRIIKWPLISSPMSMIFIALVYLFIVYCAGPRLMKNRKPYSLKTFIQCYNIFQVIANFWIVFNIVTYGKPFTATWRYCESLDKLSSNTEKILETEWWALMLKITDLIETIVFVLRKKDRQVSFLHTYHHLSTVIYVWLTVSYFNHSFSMFMLMLNCSVHFVMYSYYFLSTFGSNIQRRILPFKKCVTIIQMVHIALLTAISTQGLILNCDNRKNIVKNHSVLTIFLCFTNLLLFFNFFYVNYKKSKTT